MRTLLLVFLFIGWVSGAAAESITVDHARVRVEKRLGKEWCILDSQVSGTVAVPRERLLSVIEDYEAYPTLFPLIKSVSIRRMEDVVLLSEVVTVEVLGITNTNRFTLRIGPPVVEPARTRLGWTQEAADGTIDSLEGGWVLEDIGSTAKPLVRVSYRTQSAVPVRVPGQDLVIGLALGGETRAVLQSVFKKALTR